MPPKITKKSKSKKPKSHIPVPSDEFEFMLGAEISPSTSPPASTAINYSFLPASPRDVLRLKNSITRDIPTSVDRSDQSTDNNDAKVAPEVSESEGQDSVAVSDQQRESNAEYSVDTPSTLPQKSISGRRKSSPTKKTPGRDGQMRRTIGNDRDIKVLRDITRLQNSTAALIPKLPFARLIRETMESYCGRKLYITPECLMCLQEAAEIYAVQVMEDAYRCTLHRGRITLTAKDMKLALLLRSDSVMTNM
ncbi:histone H3-like centromeric protein A [Armigeres subalbatus]|uniref:histone H3-like centromeric protein A n=1 Tax=Armigeres subalbatus TaxID=124917 RepID=UPI002ED65AD5